MKNKGISFFIVGFMVVLIIATVYFALYVRTTSLSEESHIVLKLGHSLDQSHPVHTAMEKMAELLKEKSGGTMELRIFPNGQLGSETSAIAQVQHGAMDMTKISAAPLESFVNVMGVFSIPYVFRDSEHYWKVLDGEIGKEMLLSLEEKGMRGLCYYDSGSRSFYTIDKPILMPGDLKGMKIRVMKSKTSMDMIEALGGSPTPIPFGELYTALQQGMVDGAENNPPSFYTTRHFEVCKYYSLDQHSMIPDIVMISSKVWNELPKQAQIWLQEAADESSVFQRKLWLKKSNDDLESVKKEGVEIFYPDKKPFIEKVKPMHDSYNGTVIGDIMMRIKETE